MNAAQKHAQSPFLNREGAAVYSGYSLSTIKREIVAGRLKAVGPGQNRIRPEWIDEWMASRTRGRHNKKRADAS